jgi:ligand-binding sensor domain-containing protein
MGNTDYLVVQGNTLLVGTYASGVFISTNRGKSWSLSNNGFPKKYIQKVAIAGPNYLAVDDTVLYVSTDAGASWNPVSSKLTATYFNDLAVMGTKVIAATTKGIYSSSDNGLNWTLINSNVVGVASFTIDGSTLYASLGSKGISKSVDQGVTWTPILSNNYYINYMSVLCMTMFNNKMYAGTNEGLYYSANPGPSVKWDKVPFFTSIYTLMPSMAVSGSAMIIASQSGLFKSIDNGASFDYVNQFRGGIKVAAIDGGSFFIASDSYRIMTTTVADFTLGVPEIYGVNNISVYPNPVNGNQLTINISDPSVLSNKSLEVQFYDVTGQNIMQQSFADGGSTIDITNLPKGLYFVRVLSSEKVYLTKKILKQ